MQSSLVQAETTLDRVRNDPGEGCQGRSEKTQPDRDADHKEEESGDKLQFGCSKALSS